jgi:hypothetical protein
VFGFGDRRRERKLRANGRSAFALVLSVRRTVSGVYNSSDPFNQTPPTEVTPALWTLSVRVDPTSDTAFEATVKAWLREADRPWTDTLIPVLYDPNDRRTVVYDHSAEAKTAAQQATFQMREAWLQEQAANPVDRLTQLMERRDRGELSATDYEAQKRRLLGQ